MADGASKLAVSRKQQLASGLQPLAATGTDCDFVDTEPMHQRLGEPKLPAVRASENASAAHSDRRDHHVEAVHAHCAAEIPPSSTLDTACEQSIETRLEGVLDQAEFAVVLHSAPGPREGPVTCDHVGGAIRAGSFSGLRNLPSASLAGSAARSIATRPSPLKQEDSTATDLPEVGVEVLCGTSAAREQAPYGRVSPTHASTCCDACLRATGVPAGCACGEGAALRAEQQLPSAAAQLADALLGEPVLRSRSRRPKRPMPAASPGVPRAPAPGSVLAPQGSGTLAASPVDALPAGLHADTGSGRGSTHSSSDGLVVAGEVVLVAKRLTDSDVTYGRIILPRVAVENNLSFVQGYRSYSMTAADGAGRSWEFVVKSWANGHEHRRVYALEQAAAYLRAHRLGVRDCLGICLGPDGALRVRHNTAAVTAAAERPAATALPTTAVRPHAAGSGKCLPLICGDPGQCTRNAGCTKAAGHPGFCSGPRDAPPARSSKRRGSGGCSSGGSSFGGCGTALRLPAPDGSAGASSPGRSSGGDGSACGLGGSSGSGEGDVCMEHRLVAGALGCSRTTGCSKAAGHQGFCSNHRGFKRRGPHAPPSGDLTSAASGSSGWHDARVEAALQLQAADGFVSNGDANAAKRAKAISRRMQLKPSAVPAAARGVAQSLRHAGAPALLSAPGGAATRQLPTVLPPLGGAGVGGRAGGQAAIAERGAQHEAVESENIAIAMLISLQSGRKGRGDGGGSGWCPGAWFPRKKVLRTRKVLSGAPPTWLRTCTALH